MIQHVDVLDEAMHSGQKVAVKTKDRGVLLGGPIGVDEYDTDEERLGYYLDLGDDKMDTVFLDEIEEIYFVTVQNPARAAG